MPDYIEIAMFTGILVTLFFIRDDLSKILAELERRNRE